MFPSAYIRMGGGTAGLELQILTLYKLSIADWTTETLLINFGLQVVVLLFK